MTDILLSEVRLQAQEDDMRTGLARYHALLVVAAMVSVFAPVIRARLPCTRDSVVLEASCLVRLGVAESLSDNVSWRRLPARLKDHNYPVIEFSPLPISVVVLFSFMNVSCRPIIPGLVGPGVFTSVPLAVIGHSDGEKSSKSGRQISTNTSLLRPHHGWRARRYV